MIMNTKLQNIVISISDKLFLPVDVQYKNYFSLPLKILILLYLVYCCVIALPPIIECVTKNDSYDLPFISKVIAEQEYWKMWLPYWNFLLEIIFFVMIGGSVFSEWAAANSKSVFERLSVAVEESRKKDMDEAKEGIETKIKEYNNIFGDITIKNVAPKVLKLYRLSRDIIYILTHDVPKVNAAFLASKIGVSFPGGYYGLFAFAVFAALVHVKIAQMYLQ